MADLPKLETSGFTAKENNNTRAWSRRQPVRRSAKSSGGRQRKKAKVPALFSLGLGLMACALVCSILLVQEPFVETMAGNVESAMNYELRAGDILGKLKFVWNDIVSVFSKDSQTLRRPVEGKMSAGFSEETGCVEFTGEPDCDVYASSDGVVSEIGTGETGNYVVLRHAHGSVSTYYNLSPVCVEKDQPLSAGDALGRAPSGKIGFRYEMDGQPVNPEDLLQLR